jgi:hypothetical protein
MALRETDRPKRPVRDTYFAPAARDTPEELAFKRLLVEQAPLLRAALDAMPTIVLILNARRQIVGANAAVMRTLNVEVDDLIGRRPGEVFCCSHAHEGPGGCGTAESCAFCGAVNAVLASQEKGKQAVREAHILCETPDGAGGMDVRVTATPVTVEGEVFTVAALEDISYQKRLGVLTRIFFHDVMNTVAAMRNYVRLFARNWARKRHDPGDIDRLDRLADQLAEEVQAQRDLTLAESGDLEVEPQTVQTQEFLQRLCDEFAAQELAAGRQIALAEVWHGRLTTDLRLLSRVLGNMLRNALEATEPGGAVTVRCRRRDERVVFEVHNHAVMPKHVQMQVFHRSFSTKAPTGRGIGTHSIKLIGERYLYGKVDFTSRPPDGTTFWIDLPVSWLEDRDGAT